MRFAGSRPILLLALAACIVVSGGVSAARTVEQRREPTTTTQSGSTQQQSEEPKDSIRQNSPCADQPKSLAQLKRAFNRSKVPSGSDLTGTWVAIGIFGDARNGTAQAVSPSRLVLAETLILFTVAELQRERHWRASSTFIGRA